MLLSLDGELFLGKYLGEALPYLIEQRCMGGFNVFNTDVVYHFIGSRGFANTESHPFCLFIGHHPRNRKARPDGLDGEFFLGEYPKETLSYLVEKRRMSGFNVLNIDVVNVGGRIGSEVVQLYISPQNASLYRPKRELQAFEKVVDLAPGEEVTVTFEVDKYALSYYDDRECAWVLAAGTYDIEIGKSIEHIVLRHVLTVKETLKWTGV